MLLIQLGILRAEEFIFIFIFYGENILEFQRICEMNFKIIIQIVLNKIV